MDKQRDNLRQFIGGHDAVQIKHEHVKNQLQSWPSENSNNLMKAIPPNQINADKMQRNPPRKDYKELMKPMLDITCKTTSWVVGKHKTNADKQQEHYKEKQGRNPEGNAYELGRTCNHCSKPQMRGPGSANTTPSLCFLFFLLNSPY